MHSNIPCFQRLNSSLTKPTFSTDFDVPSPRKYRYGAWYLPKSLWQRSLVTEELRDPKVIKAEREDATRKREENMNSRLAPLHGIDAFKDYLLEKNVRRLPKVKANIYRKICNDFFFL